MSRDCCAHVRSKRQSDRLSSSAPVPSVLPNSTLHRRPQPRCSLPGVLPGAKVLLLSPMSIDLYVAIVAIFRVGATVVFVDPSAGNAHLTSCLARVRPDAFIGVGRAHLLRFMSPALRAVPIKFNASQSGGSVTERRQPNALSR